MIRLLQASRHVSNASLVRLGELTWLLRDAYYLGMLIGSKDLLSKYFFLEGFEPRSFNEDNLTTESTKSKL